MRRIHAPCNHFDSDPHFCYLVVTAKDQPFQVVSWPESGQPVLRFTFSKFNSIGSGMGKERTYIRDVMAENLSDKTVAGASSSLYLFDKGKSTNR
jgi:hypothetical protein